MKRSASQFPSGDAGNIFMMVALILLLVLGGMKLSQLVSAHILRSDALSTSDSWTASLMNGVDELPTLMAGSAPSSQALRVLDEASQVGDVYRYRIWNLSGRLIFASERIHSASKPEVLTELVGAAAARSILSGTETTFAETGNDNGDPAYYAVSYVPLQKNGKTLGIAEVYLDQTSDMALYGHSFLMNECIIAFGMLIAGAIPAVMVYRKMRDHRAAQAEALYLAGHDSLTGLPNRHGLEERAESALALANRTQAHVAALMIDMDRFKDINDNFGHSAGDEVLRQFAQRLRAAVRTEDLAVRMGGDEFFVLQVGLAQPTGAGALAQRLIEVLSEPYNVGGTNLNCGASIGIAVAPIDASDWDSLASCADAAMYKAKDEGRNTFCFFQAGMDAALRERRQIESDMRRALETGSFQLAFQPLLNCNDRRLVGFEALLRWPEGWPPQTPDKFIPIAEESGLMVPLGAWVLETACRVAAGWKTPLKIAINLSPVQFRHGDVVAAVERALQVSGLSPERLELEVTESVWLQNTDKVLDQLARLRSMGVSIALDDFGTGYSSLSYLWRFPFDKVKIDRSFVSEMQVEPKAAAIVNSVIALAQTLHLIVTAEGVETLAQADILSGLGCDQAQGYLFGRPVPALLANELIGKDESGLDLTAPGSSLASAAAVAPAAD
jgi:diguanylate cyclase (GGDEF)-like protein